MTMSPNADAATVDCLFCRIIRDEIPARILVRTPEYVAFSDIAPQAPTHVLLIPTGHVPAISAHSDPALLGRLMHAAAQLGAQYGGAAGFRLVVNEGPDGGQTVHHLHIHILAGRALRWPPG